MFTKKQILKNAGYVKTSQRQILAAAGYKPMVGAPKKLPDGVKTRMQVVLMKTTADSIPKPKSDWIRAAIEEKLDREFKEED
jgi:hypothetical protein